MLTSLVLAFLLSATAPQSAGDAAAFERLKAMAGEWRDQADGDRSMRLTYGVIAGGSAVTETWTTPSGRQTLTVYVLNDHGLTATHYCAQGNQATLRRVDGEEGLSFRLVSVAGLRDPAASHQHAFSIQPVGSARSLHSETYLEAGRTETTRYDFVRTAEAVDPAAGGTPQQ